MNDTQQEYLNCLCLVCGTKFHTKPSQIKRGGGKYCSRKCFAAAKKVYMSGEGNHQYGLKGELNASWKSDTRKSRYGYIQLRVANHPFKAKDGFVFEHRLVAEKYLLTDENCTVVNGEKYLKPELHVHHINEIKTDNRPENLVVLTKSEHQSLHAKKRNNERKRDNLGRFMKGENKWQTKYS